MKIFILSKRAQNERTITIERTRRQWVSTISRNFKIFILKPKLSFWEKITTMITRINFRIFTNSCYILKNFKTFHVNGVPSKYRANFVKIQEFIVIIFEIFAKSDNLGLRCKLWPWNFDLEIWSLKLKVSKLIFAKIFEIPRIQLRRTCRTDSTSRRKWANTNFFLELYFYSALNYIISSCPFLYYKSRKMNYCSKISIYIDKTWYLHCTHVTNTEFDVGMAVFRIM